MKWIIDHVEMKIVVWSLFFSLKDNRNWDFERSITSVDAARASSNDRGHAAKPLLPIEYENIIIDYLHLFLRIQGKLLDQVHYLIVLSLLFCENAHLRRVMT